MLEFQQIKEKTPFILVSLYGNSAIPDHHTKESAEQSLNELEQLLRTLELNAAARVIQQCPRIHAGTLIGQGKLKALQEMAAKLNIQHLVFDIELTPGQIKNIQNITGLATLDRNYIILDIFAKHAQSKGSKLQIEIAQLEYFLPRLRSHWSHFSRKKGGIGLRSGEGEQQLELDKRLIRKRIQDCKKRLKTLEISRKEQSKNRELNVLQTTLLGHTNAGKSSLLNKLCKEQTKVENKYFATIDTRCRLLSPHTRPPMVLNDTVGLISNLPPSLFAGFKSTLDALLQADLILIVCDISNPLFEKQVKLAYELLDELSIKRESSWLVFNKCDLISTSLRLKVAKRQYPQASFISSHKEIDTLELREKIIQNFLIKQPHFDLFIPYEFAQFHSLIKGQTNIHSSLEHRNGIFYRICAPLEVYRKLNLRQFSLSPDMEMYQFWKNYQN